MKNIFLATSLLCSVVSFAQAPADKVVGEYWTPKKNGKLAIYKAGNQYQGKLIWLENADKLDAHNPDPKLRNRKILGLPFMTGFVYDAGGKEWVRGKIYDAQSGKTYSCKMWLEGNDLSVRGYMGVSMLGRTETFQRIK